MWWLLAALRSAYHQREALRTSAVKSPKSRPGRPCTLAHWSLLHTRLPLIDRPSPAAQPYRRRGRPWPISFRINFFGRLVGRKNHRDGAFMITAASFSDFLRGAVSPDVAREVHLRSHHTERAAQQRATKRVRDAGRNAICYLTAEGAVFGPIGSSYRIRTRKHVTPSTVRYARPGRNTRN